MRTVPPSCASFTTPEKVTRFPPRTRFDFVPMPIAKRTLTWAAGLVTGGLVFAATWYRVCCCGATVKLYLPALSVVAVATFVNRLLYGTGVCWRVTLIPAFWGPVTWPEMTVDLPNTTVPGEGPIVAELGGAAGVRNVLSLPEAVPA